MGYHVNGILGYGFCIEENPEWLMLPGEDEEMEFKYFLARVAGLEAPDDFDNERFESDPTYAQTWSDYWRKINGLEKEFGITLEMHGSGDEPMRVMMVRDSHTECSWHDEPLALGQTLPLVKPEWREKLLTFCKRADIQFVEPQFFLCCYLVV